VLAPTCGAEGAAIGALPDGLDATEGAAEGAAEELRATDGFAEVFVVGLGLLPVCSVSKATPRTSRTTMTPTSSPNDCGRVLPPFGMASLAVGRGRAGV
jgi:hypothetical protein